MGTRHLQTVINSKGETKLSQYGQWDGYPSGQGIDILKYLRGANIVKYQEEVNKLREPTEAENKIIDADKKWYETYPYLSRDCGSRIHQMIENGEVKFIVLCDLKEAGYWCEGFYTIDFQKNTFTSEFHGTIKEYNLNELPTDEQYLYDMIDSDEEE